MKNGWFQLGPRRGQDAPDDSTSDAPQLPNTEAGRDMRPASSQNGDNGFAASGTELLVFDDIYRSAGIKSPRMGYSIGKVIEMLQSEHIRALSTETRRASLLMALEAAGVQVDEVLQDATLRQRAINSYESIQRKHLEEFEARKAQENCAIQAEMERVAAEYGARISNNLDEVSREKDSFRKWQARKQQEAQKIADAVALCVTQTGAAGSGKSGDPMSPFRELAATDPAYALRG